MDRAKWRILGALLAGLLPAAPGAALPACLEVGADCALREVAALAGVRIGAAVQPRLIEDDPLYESAATPSSGIRRSSTARPTG